VTIWGDDHVSKTWKDRGGTGRDLLKSITLAGISKYNLEFKTVLTHITVRIDLQWECEHDTGARDTISLGHRYYQTRSNTSTVWRCWGCFSILANDHVQGWWLFLRAEGDTNRKHSLWYTIYPARNIWSRRGNNDTFMAKGEQVKVKFNSKSLI
jgi:hypothetical protein